MGKWHLGERAEFGPNAHGFGYFFGFKSGYIDYYQHTAGDGSPDLYENQAPVRVDGYMTDLITERSVKFIDQQPRRPFLSGGRLQRAALAVPGAGSPVDGAGSRRARPAA